MLAAQETFKSNAPRSQVPWTNSLARWDYKVRRPTVGEGGSGRAQGFTSAEELDWWVCHQITEITVWLDLRGGGGATEEPSAVWRWRTAAVHRCLGQLGPATDSVVVKSRNVTLNITNEIRGP